MMTFGMNDEHTSYQIRSIQDQVARCRGRSAHHATDSRSRSREYFPGLRSRVGFTLVAAGLRLLPAEGSQHHS